MNIPRAWLDLTPPGYYPCPVCHATERACHVWEFSPGNKAAKCHRASCGAFGTMYQYPGSSPTGITAPTPSPEVLRPYTGSIHPLLQYPKGGELFKLRYGFDPVGVFCADYVPFPMIIPILAPNGAVRGHVEKTGLFPGEQKSNRIWKAKHEPMISWANVNHTHMGERIVWAVEDQISALKLANVGQRAVALLGTNITMEGLAEIQRCAEILVIALDADATSKAFMLARRYGSAFKQCRVEILSIDIKDDPKYNG